MEFEKAAHFIWKHGRLLERRVFEYVFFEGSKEHIVQALKAYQNDDGGFGHALEPDLRAPDSHPLYMEFALRTLYDCNIKDPEISSKACGYVAKHADLANGIPAIFKSAIPYPRASHWDHPLSSEPSFDRLVGLVGLLKWQGIYHSWLDEAAAVCLATLSAKKFEDAHTILTSFCLLESLLQTEHVTQLFSKLSAELLTSAKYLRLDPNTSEYGLSPLEFAPMPSSYCSGIFSKEIIHEHLNVMKSQQSDDGGWPISWEAPGETATWEWRACVTLKNLMLLHSYKQLTD